MSASLKRWNYSKGLHDLGNGCLGWLQPDGGWGLSNAGLITDAGEALLVDTLIDLPSTAEMLRVMQAALPAARINTVVNTHWHPDHTAGNALLPQAKVLSSNETLREMRRMAGGQDPMGDILRDWRNRGEAGAYLHEVLGNRFELNVPPPRLPDAAFDNDLGVHVGDRLVQLIKLGPAHTRGDVVVYLPRERVLYTGDVLFHEVHPAIGAEPVSNWIAACERLLLWPIEVIVPGHGPICDLSAVRQQRDYLVYLRDEARIRFDSGMSFAAAAADIRMDDFRGWADEERIYMALASLYREFGAPPVEFESVLQLAYRHRKRGRSQP